VKSSIGQRIRRIRESKDFSQENMAAELEITTSAYSKIERGVTDASASRLLQIADVLGVEVKNFFEESPPVQKAEDMERQYGFATKGDIQEIMQVLRVMQAEIDRLKQASREEPASGSPSKRKTKK
jgi:transcriptional regulator with XRE-family HTH domain